MKTRLQRSLLRRNVEPGKVPERPHALGYLRRFCDGLGLARRLMKNLLMDLIAFPDNPAREPGSKRVVISVASSSFIKVPSWCARGIALARAREKDRDYVVVEKGGTVLAVLDRSTLESGDPDVPLAWSVTPIEATLCPFDSVEYAAGVMAHKGIPDCR